MENIPRVGNIRPRGAQFLTGMRLEHIVLIACPYCKMKFSHRSVLQQHVMGVHVQELELKHRQLLIYSSSKFTFPKTVHITYNESAINHREGCLASDALLYLFKTNRCPPRAAVEFKCRSIRFYGSVVPANVEKLYHRSQAS